MIKRALNKILLRSFLVLVIFLVSFFFFNTAKPAEAFSLRGTFMRLDRMGASAPLSGTTCAKISDPATNGTEGKVVVTFPSDFTLSTTPGNWTINTAPTNGWPTIGGTTAPWVGTGTTAMAADNGAKTVTFASADLSSTAPWYCFNFTGASSTTGAAGIDKTGSIATQTSGSGAIDTGNYATSIITNDQITVTATVPPNFSLALGGGGTAPFTANLSSSSIVSTSGNSATLITNANNGWIAWVKSANAALSSASVSSTVPTAGSYPAISDLDSVTGYVLDCDITTDSATAGTGTVSFTGAGGYNGLDATQGGALTTSFQPLATANGVTDGDVLTLYARAKVNAIQKAANDYTDILTVVAAGLF
jgi:hypothetical protein